jgi:hypothetical protein
MIVLRYFPSCGARRSVHTSQKALEALISMLKGGSNDDPGRSGAFRGHVLQKFHRPRIHFHDKDGEIFKVSVGYLINFAFFVSLVAFSCLFFSLRPLWLII